MSRHDHSRCRELLGELSSYIDGEAEQALCHEIEAHIAECSDCLIMVDTLRKTITLYRAMSADPLPGDVEERLYRRLDISAFLPTGGGTQLEVKHQSRGKTSDK